MSTAPSPINIINLTPHAITLCDEHGVVAEFEPSGHVARVASEVQHWYDIPGLPYRVPVCTQQYGEIDLGCQIDPRNYYVVSSVVLAAAERLGHPAAKHLLAPDTGPQGAVRDDAGRIIGTRRFIALPVQ